MESSSFYQKFHVSLETLVFAAKIQHIFREVTDEGLGLKVENSFGYDYIFC